MGNNLVAHRQRILTCGRGDAQAAAGGRLEEVMEASSFCCSCTSCQEAKCMAPARKEDVPTKPMWLRLEGLPRVLAVHFSDKSAACRADYLAVAGAVPEVCSLLLCTCGSTTCMTGAQLPGAD